MQTKGISIMNYLSIYNKLVEYRKNNPLNLNEYGEIHHIIPKCMGGSDHKDNLVRLSAKEHYVAHHLLYKHYKTTKLAHAWFMMLKCDKNQKRFFTARQHELATKAHCDVLKESMKGKGNHFYGRTHTQETKDAIGKANAGRVKSEEEISNWVKKVAKKPKTLDHRKKIARKGLIMLTNIQTGESVRISKSEEKNYNLNLWKNPAYRQRREKCTYCNITSTVGNIKRWHNEKCKHKPSETSI
jgi:hypothetical protein